MNVVGKEVALFVQEHLAEELVKLEEFKGGNFPGALARCHTVALHDSIVPCLVLCFCYTCAVVCLHGLAFQVMLVYTCVVECCKRLCSAWVQYPDVYFLVRLL